MFFGDLLRCIVQGSDECADVDAAAFGFTAGGGVDLPPATVGICGWVVKIHIAEKILIISGAAGKLGNIGVPEVSIDHVHPLGARNIIIMPDLHKLAVCEVDAHVPSLAIANEHWDSGCLKRRFRLGFQDIHVVDHPILAAIEYSLVNFLNHAVDLIGADVPAVV